MLVRVCLWIAVIGISANLSHPVNAQSPAGPTSPSKSEKLIVQTYSVADLIVPLIDHRTAPKTRAEAADHLINVVTSKAAKDSWEPFGGAGNIRFFPNGMVLVVRQSEAVHKEIANVLAELRRQQARAEGQEKPDGVVRVVYPIADLIVPINDHSVMNDKKGLKEVAAPDKEKLGQGMVTLIKATIAPESWEKAVNGASIEFTQFGMALVVNQTEKVQGEIEMLLAGLRRAQDLQIAFELHVLELPSAKAAEKYRKFMNSNGQRLRGLNEDVVTTLSEQGFFDFLELASGDEKAAQRQAPKVTAYNGQKAFIDTRRQELGFRFDVRSVASEDRRTVRVALDFEHTLPGKVKGETRRIRLNETYHVPDARTLVWHVGDVDGTHLFVMATPRIVIAEQEEKAFLGTGPVIPRE